MLYDIGYSHHKHHWEVSMMHKWKTIFSATAMTALLAACGGAPK